MKALLRILLLVCPWVGPALQANTPDDRSPIVIMVSIDACRWDYVATFHPPVLSALAASGVQAERMLSCFPSSTFPNHYSIATGLRPEHHGIVSNSMYDPAFKAFFALHHNPGPREGRWWGGEPIWVTAGKQGVRNACMFWPGSEAEIAGHRPDLWQPYDGKRTCSDRVHTVLEWLQLPPAERPRLITLYFDVVDTAGHDFGPATPQVRDALADVDHALGELVAGVQALGLADRVNYVITSDHGMARISRERRITLDDHVDPADVQIDFKGAYAGLRPRRETAAQLVSRLTGKHPHLHACLREDVPTPLHYRAHLRIPPVVLIADPGWMIGTRESFARDDEKRRGNGGAHGYDPHAPDMGATFIAAGPAIKPGMVIPPFENIHLYDFVCRLLNLQPAPNDGDNRLAFHVLRN